MAKYALVTGSSDRIGKGVSLLLADMGFNLLLHYHSSAAKARTLKKEIENKGQMAKLVSFDFLKTNDFDTLFAVWKREGIEMELLVNCAADFQPSGFDDKGSTMLNKEFKINFENAYLLTKAFAHVYGKGQIINFIDTKAEKNYSTHLDYILSKKQLREFTKLSAVELAPRFRVNGISPGLVLPPQGKDEGYLKKMAKNIPLKTIGDLNEIFKAFRFLVESTFVTGQIIYVDGGDHLL